MSAPLLRVEVADHVRTITLDSQHNRNALSRAMVDQLTTAIGTAGDDPETRVVVIAADGPAFCAGADLKEMTGADDDDRARGTQDMLRLFHAILACPRPVVTRVHAAVRAGGIGIVAASDIAIAASSVRFALTEVRLGLAPAVISLVVGPRMTSRGAGRTWLTGETFDAASAAEIGLLTSAVADDDLDAAVRAVTDDVVASPVSGLAAAKQILNRDLLADLEARGPEMAALSAELFSSPTAQELMGAFLRR